MIAFETGDAVAVYIEYLLVKSVFEYLLVLTDAYIAGIWSRDLPREFLWN